MCVLRINSETSFFLKATPMTICAREQGFYRSLHSFELYLRVPHFFPLVILSRMDSKL